MRIDTALRQARERLAVSPSADLDAQILLCHVLERPRSYLFTWPERTLNEEQQQRFESLLIRREAGEPVAFLTVRARDGMVVTSQADASRAGAAMLARGGNAVDAAVAAAFALGVTQPFSAGIGGGAFLLIRSPEGELVALDARETALARTVDPHRDRPEGVPEVHLAAHDLSAAPQFACGLFR